MARGNDGSKQRNDNQLWVNTGPDVGQPKFKDDWDADEYNRLRAQSPSYVRWKKREHWDRDEREAFTQEEIEELLERFENEWVNPEGKEWQKKAWFQSVKKEILTGKRPDEGIRLLAQWSVGEGFATIKKGPRKGQVRPRWEIWLDSYRQGEAKVKKEFHAFIQRVTGRPLHPAMRKEEEIEAESNESAAD
jgi:hypothetical protein